MVFAATSLSEVLKELAWEFKKEYKVDVNFNFGGSSSLRVQIEKGAPCDIFFAADKVSNEKLLAQKIIVEQSMVKLLKNRLVVVADEKNEEVFSSLYDIRLKKGDHLAVADPQTSPAGAYAIQALHNAGLENKYQPFIAPTLDVRAALALVQSGNAKYAIVYFSDTKSASHLKMLYSIPGRLHEPIVYTLALIASSPRLISAREFLSFLQTERSKMIFEKYGFQTF